MTQHLGLLRIDGRRFVRKRPTLAAVVRVLQYFRSMRLSNAMADLSVLLRRNTPERICNLNLRLLRAIIDRR